MPRPTPLIRDAQTVLRHLGFGEKQANEMAALVLLALADLGPRSKWANAKAPLRGITPIMEFIGENFAVPYKPNTRETVRDEAVKYFAAAGLLLRNPDSPSRPTNSPNYVYQLEPHALALLRSRGSPAWDSELVRYLELRAGIRAEMERERSLVQIPVTLPGGATVSLSAGGQNPLVKAIVEQFCPRFTPGGLVVYVGDTATKHSHLQADYLANLGITLSTAEKMPDVVIHDRRRQWLVLIEAVASAGPVDGKRRAELKRLFRSPVAGLVFVTAFATRRAMQGFLGSIAWESEVWIAEAPDHLIHFNGERFLGPYPDAMPTQSPSIAAANTPPPYSREAFGDAVHEAPPGKE
ncbi:MAG TPA: BsuBI/PstI family type II restriction endonuclease [Opitutaceae bacterium]|nr:BsuBI/PstI family type II restriction endonuclease [Opitutaceae bacterium]